MDLCEGYRVDCFFLKYVYTCARVATSYPANRPVPFTLALDSLLRVVGNRRCIA